MIKPCIHCGKCCLSGIPCYFGQILFNITEDNPAPCPACEKVNDLYWCGLIKNPMKYFPNMVGNVKWKCEAMSEIAALWIGIGDGCGMNPTKKQIIERMRTYTNHKTKVKSEVTSR